MQSRIQALLEQALARGGFRIGQIQVHPDFSLHHIDDTPDDPGLRCSTDPTESRRIALWTDDNVYRPLKTAPNLPHGWILKLANLCDLRIALDYFYPAALGLWAAYAEDQLTPTDWRETVNRQTGMYRVVGLITNEQSLELIGSTCQRETGCLRRILWNLESGKPHPLTVQSRDFLLDLARETEIPLLCIEACNLLVAAGRPIVKAAQKAAAEAAAAAETAAPAD